ncbi:MAG: OFA family MFS transporter [Candidatus Hodarchaeota archaeon]
MSQEEFKNRWIVVIGAILVQLALGSIYSWGTLSLFISGGAFLKEPAEVTVYIFGVSLLFFGFTMIFAGKLQQKYGPKKIAIIGGILIGIGAIASAGMTSFIGLLITYGIIFGAGIGFTYVCPIACAAKWFPDKKGFINGIAVAGFGAGAFLFNYFIKWLSVLSIPTMFILLGIIYLAFVLGGAMTLNDPPEGWTPANWTPPPPSDDTGISGLDLNRKEMVKHKQFWMLWTTFVFSAICGLMTIGAYSSFAKSNAGYPINDFDFLVLVGSLAALFNGVGRVFWGKLSDIIYYKKAMMIMFTIQGFLMITLFFTSGSIIFFLIWVCSIYYCFGGNFAMFPTATSDLFGTKNLGENYGVVFTSYGIAGFLGATMVLTFVTLLGGYIVLFIVMGIMSIGATMITFILKPPKK